MGEKPILFSGDMVRAILEGRKTQTRRLSGLDDVDQSPASPEWWKPPAVGPLGYMTKKQYKGMLGATFFAERPGELLVCPTVCPCGQPGDRLWVREMWSYRGGDEYLYLGCKSQVIYRAGCDVWEGLAVQRWRPSIHMPRWASRLTLEIVNVRVERLQEISEEDAKAEGVRPFGELYPAIGPEQRLTSGELASERPHRSSFAVLWDELNDKKHPWISNPCVWVIEFKVIEGGPDA